MEDRDNTIYERIIEIIVYVITELRQNKNFTEIDVKELQKRGYSNIEISTAFSWLVDRIEISQQLFTQEKQSQASSFRVLHEAEKDLFTQEAWGELIQLNSLGIVTNEHIEMIIDRAILSGFRRVDNNLLKSFVAMVIFNVFDDNQTGSRLMLHGNDTIH